MTRTTMWRSLAVAGAAALVLSACSSDDGGSDDAADVPAGDGTLTIGTILPVTGSLAFLGPPEIAGTELAIQEINEGGGYDGKDVVISQGDSGDTSTDIANQTVDRLLSENADTIIGAASSSVSLTVIDKITGAGVVQFSPANTSIALSTYDDGGLYWRTAPPDTLQGSVLATLALDEGNGSAAILALQDAYGEGLANSFETNFTEGGGTITSKQIYDPKAANFSAEVSQAASENPDAIVLIGFEESKTILQELIKQGIGPDNKKLYLVDGNLSNTIADGLPAGIMEGTKGTLPGAEAPQEFRDRLLAIDPALTDFSYAAESYDAVILTALAAIAAGSDNGEAIASQLQAVSTEGEQCDNFADCKALLDEGKDIDYEGVSGPIEFGENGDPTFATMGIYEFGPDNTYPSTAVQYISGPVPPVEG